MSKPRILIAEDERIVAEDIKRTLEGFGYAISSITSTGEACIKKSQEEKTDLVLMDIVLGGKIDGIEAARQISGKLNIPVVFLTARAEEGTLIRVKITEPCACVKKPLADREPRAAVKGALSRYDMEARLKESERFCSNLLAYAPNPIIVINPDTSVRYVNPALERLTGYSLSEIIGVKVPYPWYIKETAKKSERNLKEAMRKGNQRHEALFQTKTGERFWVEISAMPVKEEGEFKYFIANWIDITERKRAEEVMSQTQVELRIRNRIAEIFLTIPDEEMYGEVLQVILEAMESQYGIFGYINEHGTLIVPSLSRDIWEQCQVPNKTIEFPRNTWAGIWGRALKEKRSLYSNEGLCVPSGHVPISKVLVVPIIYRDEVIGILEVANKPHDYGKKDREFLETIAAHVAPILNARLQRDRQERARNQVEIALREKEERMRAIFKAAKNTSFILTDTQGTDARITEFSPGAEHIFGYTREEVLGKPVAILHRQADIERFPRIFDAMSKNRLGFFGETTLVRKSGAEFPALFSTAPVIDSTGEMTSALGVSVDISELKQAEEALRESEANYRELADSITDVFFAMDKNLTYTYWNKASEKVTGIAAKDAIGKSIRLLFGDVPPTRKAIKAYRDVLRTKQPKNFINEHCVGGKCYFFDISAYPSRGGLAVFVKDITDHKRTVEALRESEEKYRLLVEHSNDAIFISQDGVVKFSNPRTEEMFGYSAEELVTIPFTDLVHPEDRDIVIEKYRRRFRGEERIAPYSFRIFNKHGEELWVQLNAVLISWEGKPATLNFLRDTTQQKRLEAQLIQAQKMEAIGTLAGGIAHDFNNLLMGILGFSSLMLMDLEPAHPHYDRLQGIEGLVLSGAELTKQLLGFAQGGKYEVRPIDLNEVVKMTSGMFSRTKKEITIHRKFQRDIWPIEADGGQIEQVLLNLYVNAWQAMPGGGELYLSTENFTLDEDQVKPFNVEPGRYVRITVTDTGAGMDEQTRQRIFEPFFTTKERGRGTGLGLASVYGIIKNHGGYIEVDSREGEGTTFSICLPASGRRLMEKKEVPRDIVPGTGTVLLVDDEEVMVKIGEKMLTALGYEAVTAKGGREALEVYEKQRDTIDLVILDMIMPEMSGGEVYDRLKEINPELRVLLSSGYSIEGQAREILERGCNGFIQKPFDMRMLSRKIREILDQ
jgi:two-component system cell cycle sensor histidine kinase/response regulator CckA